MALSVPQTLNIIEAQRGAALRLRAGETLRIVAIEAEQVADLALYDARDPRDGFSPGRTIDYNESLDLRAGSMLYSHRSAALAQVVEDTTGVHDMLLTPCSRVMFERRGQNAHASCHENLYTNLARFGITSDDVAATVNVFMDVRVNSDRTVAIFPPASKPGDRFSVRALREILIGVTACSSELTNAGRCKPISFEVLPSP
jgi:uncharacterized protein YcgI (DUF1989 family)